MLVLAQGTNAMERASQNIYRLLPPEDGKGCQPVPEMSQAAEAQRTPAQYSLPAASSTNAGKPVVGEACVVEDVQRGFDTGPVAQGSSCLSNLGEIACNTEPSKGSQASALGDSWATWRTSSQRSGRQSSWYSHMHSVRTQTTETKKTATIQDAQVTAEASK